MKRSRTIREATELNATQGGENMNRNETNREMTESDAIQPSVREFLGLVRAAAVAHMQHTPNKTKTGQQRDSLTAELMAAVKPMSKADAKELVALLDAAISGRCCYQEMVAAMLDEFGAKYRSHSTVCLLGIFVLRALKDMGLPDDPRHAELVHYVATGGYRTKALLACSMVESEALYLLDPDSGALVTEDICLARTIAAGRHLAEFLGIITDDPDCSSTTKSSIAHVAGLIAKAKQNHHCTADAMPQVTSDLSEEGWPDALAKACAWVGCRIGEHVGSSVRSRIDQMSIFSPWFVGTMRARTSAEMLRDASTVAAA